MVGYLTTLLNNVFGTTLDAHEPQHDPGRHRALIVVQTLAQHGRREGRWASSPDGRVRRDDRHVRRRDRPRDRRLPPRPRLPVHHARAPRTSTSNPLGVDFDGNWLTGAALVAVLAHTYIFYGFESAGDVAEETKTGLPAGAAGDAVVAALRRDRLVRAGRRAAAGHARRPEGLHERAVVHRRRAGDPGAAAARGRRTCSCWSSCIAFFSCGTAVQGAGSRLIYSYARDGAAAGQRLGAPGVAALPHAGQRAARRRDRARAVHAAGQREPDPRRAHPVVRLPGRASTRSPRWSPSASPGSTCRSCSR